MRRYHRERVIIRRHQQEQKWVRAVGVGPPGTHPDEPLLPAGFYRKRHAHPLPGRPGAAHARQQWQADKALREGVSELFHGRAHRQG